MVSMAEDGLSSCSQKLTSKATTAASQMRTAKAHDRRGNPATVKGNCVVVAIMSKVHFLDIPRSQLTRAAARRYLLRRICAVRRF